MHHHNTKSDEPFEDVASVLIKLKPPPSLQFISPVASLQPPYFYDPSLSFASNMSYLTIQLGIDNSPDLLLIGGLFDDDTVCILEHSTREEDIPKEFPESFLGFIMARSITHKYDDNELHRQSVIEETQAESDCEFVKEVESEDQEKIRKAIEEQVQWVKDELKGGREFVGEKSLQENVIDKLNSFTDRLGLDSFFSLKKGPTYTSVICSSCEHAAYLWFERHQTENESVNIFTFKRPPHGVYQHSLLRFHLKPRPPPKRLRK